MTEKITAADAIRLLDTGKAVAVDVREPDEYAVQNLQNQLFQLIYYCHLTIDDYN